MSKILLSIKPEFVEKILDGTKRYEFRKRLAKDVAKIVVYSTAPIKLVVAEVDVIGTIECPKQELWDITHEYAGIDRTRFYEYFSDCKNACAYVLGNVVQYDTPKSLDEYGLSLAPQSFIYIVEDPN